MVEGIIDVGSNCLEDITNSSWQNNVQGLNYIPSLEGDENTNTSDEMVTDFYLNILAFDNRKTWKCSFTIFQKILVECTHP